MSRFIAVNSTYIIFQSTRQVDSNLTCIVICTYYAHTINAYNYDKTIFKNLHDQW